MVDAKSSVETSGASAAPPAILVQAPERTGWAGQLSAAAAILGAFFALGQTASQIVQGYYQHQIELAKSKQDLDLAKQRSDSELASSFLSLILNKDTPEDKRSMLFDALSTLQTHPLHQWAQARHEAIEKNLAALEHARDAQLAAYQEKDEATRDVSDLKAQIQEKASQISIHREDTSLTENLHNEQIRLVQQLAAKVAVLSRAESKVAIVGGAGSGNTIIQTSTTEVVSFHLPIDRIRTALSLPRDRELYDKYMPYLESALVESKLTNPSTVAAIISIAAFNTADFRTNVEYASGTAYEGRKDLGNVEAGDGERFKGRGLIEITGRANYAKYSELLGLGTLLLDSPDDVNRPEIATRMICTFFIQTKLDLAAEQDDVVTVFRRVNGGLNGLDRFRAIYASVKTALAPEQPATKAGTQLPGANHI